MSERETQPSEEESTVSEFVGQDENGKRTLQAAIRVRTNNWKQAKINAIKLGIPLGEYVDKAIDTYNRKYT